MLHTIKLQPHPFDKIKEGSKTIEVRLFDEKRRAMQLGDTIEFRREPEQSETVTVEIIGLLNYPTFRDLVGDFPVSHLGDDDQTKLLERIDTFYTKTQEAECSVLCFWYQNPTYLKLKTYSPQEIGVSFPLFKRVFGRA